MPDGPAMADAPAPVEEPHASARQARTGPRPARNLVALAAVAGLLAGALSGSAAAILLRGGDRGEAPAPPGDTRIERIEQTTRVAEVAALGRASVVRIDSTRLSGQRTERDTGSGVIFDRQGFIVTNAHVVLDTDSLEVTLPDGSKRGAFIVGHDHPFTDVAVINIGPVDIPAPLSFGDSSRLVPGETVVVVGNPLSEFGWSVSVGVVSGLNRSRVFNGVAQDDLVQIDAAVNHGNSGGALLNLAGELVGIPTSVIRSAGGEAVEGISFALPANRLRPIVEEIVRTSANYPRPELGLEAVDLSDEVAARVRGLAAREGALVTGVVAGGPAEAAGIAPGDILVSIAGVALGPATRYLNTLLGLEPGQRVAVVLNRNGRIIEVHVVLATRR